MSKSDLFGVAAIAAAALSGLQAGVAGAQELVIDPSEIVGVVSADEWDCPIGGCGSAGVQSEQELVELLAEALAERRLDSLGRFNPAAPLAPGAAPAPLERRRRGPQRVFLDFDSGVPAFEVLRENANGTLTLLGRVPSHVYTPEERAAILSLIQADVRRFGIVVSTTQPSSGEFSTLSFNADLPLILIPSPRGGFVVDVIFGEADNVDHNNHNFSDGARVAAHFWEFFARNDPSGASFSQVSGLPVDAAHPLASRVSEAVIRQSAQTGAHELGHLLGLRHHDAFGAVGDGLPANGRPSPLSFVPVYEGPTEATETLLHVMATGSTGQSAALRATSDAFFSERSSLKLALGRLLPTEPEARACKGTLRPERVRAPNAVLSGESSGQSKLDAQALSLAGRIAQPGEIDTYRFRGEAGSVWTVELVSMSDLRILEPVITDLNLFLERRDGSRQLIAHNAQTFEPYDPLLLDVVLPVDGRYVVEVLAPDTVHIDSDGDGFDDDPVSLDQSGLGEFRRGDYELLMYSLDLACHEPPAP
jgi:hypothetical protein